MNMKSITAAAQSISFIPFVFSLRMRKQIENEMKLKGIAAWMGMKFEFGLLFCSRGDYGRQRPHGREPREKTREDKQTQTECLFFLFFSPFLEETKEIERKERESWFVSEMNEM